MSSTEIKSFAQVFSKLALLVKAACKLRATPLSLSADGEILKCRRAEKIPVECFCKEPSQRVA